MKNKLNKLISSGVFKDVSFLDNYNCANLFNVVNKGEKSYFNLCRSIYFDIEDISPDLITIYEVAEGDTWTNILYRNFGTIKLWWLICKFNNIKNPFEEIEAGKIIKIPSKELMETIINVIQTK